MPKLYSGTFESLKRPDICLTGGDTLRKKKKHPGNLSRPEIEPGPAALHARMPPPFILVLTNYDNVNRQKRRPRGASGQTLASHRWGPEFASRSLHVGFVVDETGPGQVFHGVSPVFLYHKFHSTISPHSSHPFRFISYALVMVHQAWSAGTLATHRPIMQGLHCISSLDLTLCWTRVEDIHIHGNGKIFNSSNIFLLSVLMGTCFVILRILFCNRNSFVVLEDNPQTIMPYDNTE